MPKNTHFFEKSFKIAAAFIYWPPADGGFAYSPPYCYFRLLI